MPDVTEEAQMHHKAIRMSLCKLTKSVLSLPGDNTYFRTLGSIPSALFHFHLHSGKDFYTIQGQSGVHVEVNASLCHFSPLNGSYKWQQKDCRLGPNPAENTQQLLSWKSCGKPDILALQQDELCKGQHELLQKPK